MASYWDINAGLRYPFLLSRGGRPEYTASLHPRPSVRGEEPHPTRGDPVYAEHSGSKEKSLKNNPPSYGVGAEPTG